jgi:uncharacterized membrane protein YbhN (UPF0104 family)
LSHNIGASVFSGAMVRYRAYSTKGLTATQVATLVVLCSYVRIATCCCSRLLLTYDPAIMQRLPASCPIYLQTEHRAVVDIVPGLRGLLHSRIAHAFSRVRLFDVRNSLSRAPASCCVSSSRLLGVDRRSRIIYFALPEQGNLGFLVVLGVSLSFPAALSHAPGGRRLSELHSSISCRTVPR